jgi:hypothetical protein
MGRGIRILDTEYEPPMLMMSKNGDLERYGV